MEDTRNGGQMTGRFYTSARRFKQVLGSLPDGTKIPGGPYTYSQIGVILGTLAVGWLARGIWGSDSAIRDLIILLAVAIGLGFLMGKLPPSRRNPLKLMGSVLVLLTHPGPGGKWRGKSLKLSTKAQKIQRDKKQADKVSARASEHTRTRAASTTPEPLAEPAGYGSSLNRLMLDNGLVNNTERK